MSSFHERWFEKRWYGFWPKRREGVIVMVVIALGLIGLILAANYFQASGREGVGLALYGIVFLVMLVWNGMGLTRSDM